MDKKKIRERLPEPKPIGKPLSIVTSSSPANAKPNVVCSQSVRFNKKLHQNLSMVCRDNDIVKFMNYIIEKSNKTKGFYQLLNCQYKSNGIKIVVKIKSGGLYFDLTQIRDLYSLMSSNPKVVIPPSKPKTTDT